MVGTFGFLAVYILTAVNSYNVKLTKRSTIYLPHSYLSNGTGEYGLFEGSAGYMAYDHLQKVVYAVGGKVLHAIDVSDPDNMAVVSHLEYPGMEFTDVEFCGGHIFTALDNKTDRANGQVIIFSQHNKATSSMTELMQIHVGTLPDALKPTRDCSKLVVAVEGEAYETPAGQFTDPPGLVVIISFTNGVNTNYDKISLNFTYYNDKVDDLSKSGVRHVYQENNNSFSNDVEPEYIAINHDDTIAYVALQENNGIAVIDLVRQTITGIRGLGFKDWSKYTLDPSDKDNGAMMFPYSLMGMYQPDSIANFRFREKNYLLMANEGDSKEYDSWSEEIRIQDISSNTLPDMDATTRDQIKRDELLSRLKVSVSPAGMNASRLKAFYTFGGRGFSIRRADDMSLVYDSGDDISRKTFEHRHTLFNADADKAGDRPFENFDDNSDNKGPRTQSLTVGEVGGVTLLFVANGSPGTIFVYSLHSDINSPMYHDIYDGIPDTRGKSWAQLYDERRVSEIDPEDLHFIQASHSPTGKPVLFATGAKSGTISIINVDITLSPPVTTPPVCTSSVMRIGDGPSSMTLIIGVVSLYLMWASVLCL